MLAWGVEPSSVGCSKPSKNVTNGVFSFWAISYSFDELTRLEPFSYFWIC